MAVCRWRFSTVWFRDPAAVVALSSGFLALDAIVVAVRYAPIVGSEQLGGAVAAGVLAVLGIAGTLASLMAPHRSLLVRAVATSFLVPFALLTFLVGVLELADGELVGAGIRSITALMILALIKPALFPPR